MPLEILLLCICLFLVFVPGIQYLAFAAIPVLLVIAVFRFIGAIDEVFDALDERLNR